MDLQLERLVLGLMLGLFTQSILDACYYLGTQLFGLLTFRLAFSEHRLLFVPYTTLPFWRFL